MYKYREFSGCNKCGFLPSCSEKAAESKFCGQGAAISQIGEGITKTIEHEAIRRTCKRCGYIWYELPIDVNSETTPGKIGDQND